jgi:hypothetical protein
MHIHSIISRRSPPLLRALQLCRRPRCRQGPLFAVFFVFVVTLGLFPGVTVNISSQQADPLCWCATPYVWRVWRVWRVTECRFPVVIFSAFNLGDTTGRVVSGRCGVCSPAHVCFSTVPARVAIVTV